jgi:hypothetical protein
MTAHSSLPKVGDRVRIDDRGELFVVVEVNEETQSVSVLPESEILTVDVDKLVLADRSQDVHPSSPLRQPARTPRQTP